MLKPTTRTPLLLLPTKPLKFQYPFPKPTIISKLTKLLQLSTFRKHLQILHTQLLVNGLQSNLILSTKLSQSYSLAGDPQSAHLVFDHIGHFELHPFSWNVMLRGYSINNQSENALKLYTEMTLSGIKPDNFTFSILVGACASLSALNLGPKIHGQAIVNGYSSNAFVETALIDLYVKSGCLGLAYKVFDQSSKRDIALWNSMISGFLLSGHAFEALETAAQMEKLYSLKPDRITLIALLSAFGELGISRFGKEAHAYIIRHGLDSAITVANSLIDMYNKCECLDYAICVFTTMANKDSSSWNVMISGFHKNGIVEQGLILFREMLMEGVKPTLFTIITVLPICASLGALGEGKQLHAHITKTGFQLDFRIETALIDMYAKCGSMDDSLRAFSESIEKDLITWNAMITGCALNSLWREVLELFQQLQLTGMKPDSITLNSLLMASDNLQAIGYAKSIHGYIIRNWFEAESLLLNSLVYMYANCGRINEAYDSLVTHSKTDPIPWNGLLLAVHPGEALNLYLQMKEITNIKPNLVTFLNLLSVCTRLAAPSTGKLIHGCILKSGFQSYPTVSTSLLNMYAKCGDIESAISVFDRMVRRDTVSWSTAIGAYGAHGLGLAALQLFAQMRAQKIRIDQVAFAEILGACTHSGLMEEGWACFKSMEREHSLMPELKHYTCMVDLFGRAGRLYEAEEFIGRMPIKPDASVWRPLLSACRIHGDVEMGQRVFKQLFKLEPQNTANYVLMSNIFARAGRWEEAAEVRRLLQRKQLIKTLGCSWMEKTAEKHT